MQSRAVEIVVGLFVALGVAALFMLAMRVSNIATLTEGGGYDITARFNNIGSLKVRAPVTMAGVTIGRVTDIGFDEKTYQAVVTMEIQHRYDKLPDDTSASIFTQGLLGEQYVSLEPGADQTYLKNGSRIQLTQSAVVLEQLIGHFLYSKAAGGGGQ